MNNIKKNRVVIVGNLILLLFAVFIYTSHAIQSVDSLLQDYQFKKAADHEPNENIVVVAIDNYSIEQLGQFPWDRSIYSPFLEQLNFPSFEPSSIAFDINFSEASSDDSDEKFAEALAQYDNVILPIIGVTEGDVFRHTQVSQEAPLQVHGVIPPYEPFAQLTHQAHINRVTSHDGVIRKMWLKINSPDGESIPILGYKALELAGYDLSFYDDKTDIKKTSDHITKHTLTIDYNMLSDDFLTVSFFDVLNGDIPPEIFADSIVFIGFTATGIGNEAGLDSGVTPLERDAKLVYVHANIADQLMENGLIRYLPSIYEIILLIFMFVLFIWLAWRFKSIYTFVLFFLTVLLLFMSQQLVFKYLNTYMYISAIALAMVLAFIFNLSLKAYREQQQRNFVTRQFGRYISPDLVKEIVNQGIDIQLGGVSKQVTVLFLDIRGFTSLSEKLTPAEVVDILNAKFTMITNTALKYNGSIDKFIGDAAMILFNAPLDVEHHESQAVLTAYHIQQNMKVIQQDIQEKYGVEVAIGIGIHAGPVVIGNIGSYLRMDYTAIGDTVNTASRIESNTTKGQILVSEEVYEMTKHIAEYGEPTEKLFKGKSQPIKVYELITVKEG